MATKVKVIYTVAAEFVIDTDDTDQAIAAGDHFAINDLMEDGCNLFASRDQVVLADDPIPDGFEQVYGLDGRIVE